MDKLYGGDIPTEYHFARFGNGYIDLYNTQVLHNGTILIIVFILIITVFIILLILLIIISI